jgi:hypothetical protein
LHALDGIQNKLPVYYLKVIVIFVCCIGLNEPASLGGVLALHLLRYASSQARQLEVISLLDSAPDQQQQLLHLLHQLLPTLPLRQCCGAGPFLCGSDYSFSNISGSGCSSGSGSDHFPYILEKIQKFPWFIKIFMLFENIHDGSSKGSLK